MFVRANFVDIYLQGMRDRSMGSGTELAREIKLTDLSMAGNLSNRSSGVQIPRDICTRRNRYFYSVKPVKPVKSAEFIFLSIKVSQEKMISFKTFNCKKETAIKHPQCLLSVLFQFFINNYLRFKDHFFFGSLI